AMPPARIAPIVAGKSFLMFMIFPLTQFKKRLAAKSFRHCTRALYNRKMHKCNKFFQKNYNSCKSVVMRQH
ncbi:MAG: hypothetical protein OEU51_06350, partial [Gammaproteobacteria bacterium]|nr:hypothetical protein [Gammaproteobacteria bacterium]